MTLSELPMQTGYDGSLKPSLDKVKFLEPPPKPRHDFQLITVLLSIIMDCELTPSQIRRLDQALTEFCSGA